MLLSGVAIGGGAGWFGVFGGIVASDPPPFILLSILAFSMGMQNAAVASTTGLAVRTTHLTGPMTDLGIHLGAALRGGKVLAFVSGAAISVSLSAALGYFILLPAALFVTVAAVLSFLPEWSPSDYPYSTKCRESQHQGDRSASRVAIN